MTSASPATRPVTHAGAQTRARIMEALVEVITAEGISEFSVQAVADRAGVSHRTVYRHFPSRESLLEGLTEHVEAPMRASGLSGVPRSIDELVGSIEPLFEFFDEHAAVMEAVVVVRLALGIEPTRSRERTRAIEELVRAEAPNLTDRQARTFAMGLRAIASSQQWLVLTRRLGLGTEEAAEVTTQSLRALIGEVRRRNARQQPKEGR